jgi:hypothetical protein
MSWGRRLGDAVLSAAETLERSQALARDTALLLSDADECRRTARERLVLAELVTDDLGVPDADSRVRPAASVPSTHVSSGEP